MFSLINLQSHHRYAPKHSQIYIVHNEALRLSLSEHRADSKLNCSGATRVAKSR